MKREPFISLSTMTIFEPTICPYLAGGRGSLPANDDAEPGEV